MKSEDVWDCEYFARCLNNERCLTCGPTQRLLKLKNDSNRRTSQVKSRQNTVTQMDDNSGKTLEDYVRDSFNALPTVKEYQAHRQAGSGNIWFMPGDVKDSVCLTECKERGTTTSKGEKNITIPKAMLEKIAEEARMYNTYPALVFRYKADTSGKTYFVQEFEILAEMVQEIKFLRTENEEVRNERDMYKKLSQELHLEVLRLKGEIE